MRRVPSSALILYTEHERTLPFSCYTSAARSRFLLSHGSRLTAAAPTPRWMFAAVAPFVSWIAT
jgi:hypothetical protein